MEGPGPEDPYEHAGWTMPFWSDEIGKFKLDELKTADALLLGRETYEGFARAWPSRKDEEGFADRMNGLPKYVLSGTLKELHWNNSHLIEGDFAQGVSGLKMRPGRDVLVAGSARLVGLLMQHSLVDEFRLLVYPVVLGSGKRLFREASKTELRLVESRPVGTNGVVLLRYGQARPGAAQG